MNPGHDPLDPSSGAGEPVAGDPSAEVGANTEQWRAFANADPSEVDPGWSDPAGPGSDNRFRVLSLLVGLAVFAVLVYLLLR